MELLGPEFKSMILDMNSNHIFKLDHCTMVFFVCLVGVFFLLFSYHTLALLAVCCSIQPIGSPVHTTLYCFPRFSKCKYSSPFCRHRLHDTACEIIFFTSVEVCVEDAVFCVQECVYLECTMEKNSSRFTAAVLHCMCVLLCMPSYRCCRTWSLGK